MTDSISSLASYMQWVQDQRNVLDELNRKLRRVADSEYEIFFRGVSNRIYKDVPSVFRDGLYRSEDVIFNEAVSRNYSDFAADKTTFDMLVRMQHYSVPTRLLDITTDPLVALYFATKASSKGSPNALGKVIAYFVGKGKTFYSDSPEVCLYANLARGKGVFSIDEYSKENLEHLKKIASQENPECSCCDKYDLLNICCVKPRMNNQRIIRQNGAFLLFGQITSKAFSPVIQDVSKIMRLTDIRVYLQKGEPANSRDNGRKTPFGKNEFDRILKEHIDELRRPTSTVATIDEIIDARNNFFTNLKTKIREHLSGDFKNIMVYPHSDKHSRAKQIARSIDRISYCSAMFDILDRRGSIGKSEILVDKKGHIANELESYGITEESLFPELDVLGKSLRKKFERK